jgi:Ca-activated chloride channel family protein
MRRLARMAGGSYRLMTPDDSDIQFLVNRFEKNVGNQAETAGEFETDVWQEQGPWLLLLVLPLAALAFRRGYLIAVLIFIMPFPDTAQAFDWDSLWLRADQRAVQELEAGNSEAAAELFDDPAWKAAAQYRAGDFQSTVESLEKAEDIQNLYNRGNALARLGQYEEAISNYDQVLEQMPDHEDAKFNKELLEEELEKQQQQNQQQQSQDQQEQDQEKEQEKQDSDQQQQDGQEGEQDKQQQEQQNSEKENNEQQQQNGQNQEQQQSESEKKDQEMSPEQKQKQEQEQAEAEKNKAEQQQSEQQKEEQQQQLAEARQEELDEEQQQATEQWLRRIPDDPAGLLRRKFRYQYQQRQGQQSAEEKKW